MLELLKKYIDNAKKPRGEPCLFVEMLLKYTRDERLLENLITSSREHPWDCKNRADDVVYPFFYFHELHDDIFHDYSQCYEDLCCGFGTISIVLLLCLYCFFDKDDLIIKVALDDNAGVVDKILHIINVGGDKSDENFYKEYRKYHKFIKSIYTLEHDYLTPEYCEIVDGEVDYDTYECDSSAHILMIKLVNIDKLKEFRKVMKGLGFYNLVDNTYAVDTFEDTSLNFPYFNKESIGKVRKLLNKNKPIREVSHWDDVIDLYELPESVVASGSLLIEDIMNENHSADEVLL